jgi:hypothetical protein
MILDAHTHAFPPEVCRRREDFFADEPAFRLLYGDPRARLVEPEELVAALDENGVDRAVVMGFPWRREAGWRRQHEVLLEAKRRWPEKLIPFCTVNPLEPGAVREVERCLAAGFQGVGELAWYADDPGSRLEMTLTPLAELCQHYQVPLSLHVNDPLGIGHAYPGKAAVPLAALYQCLKNTPGVTWMLAHWGGGLPFYGLCKKETAEVFRRVYFDTAASPYLYHPAIYRAAAEMVGPEKILFGSDFPLLPVSRYLKELEEADLPEDWRKQILGQNLAGILGC